MTALFLLLSVFSISKIPFHLDDRTKAVSSFQWNTSITSIVFRRHYKPTFLIRIQRKGISIVSLFRDIMSFLLERHFVRVEDDVDLNDGWEMASILKAKEILPKSLFTVAEYNT